jgi:hypothetical protein
VRIHPDRSGRGPDCPRLSRNQRARRRFNFKRCPSDTSSLSPFAQLAGAFQQLQQADPAAYAKLTRQIATSLQNESQTAQSQGNSGVAGELSQLANDFTTASQTGQLPNLQDLAQAVARRRHDDRGERGARRSPPSSFADRFFRFEPGVGLQRVRFVNHVHQLDSPANAVERRNRRFEQLSSANNLS